MSKKTMVPINLNGTGYKMAHGTASGTSVDVTFDSKVIAVFATTTWAGSKYAHIYAVNTSSQFFEGYEDMFGSTYPPTNPLGYAASNGTSASIDISDNKITLNCSYTGASHYYTAILEEDYTEHAIFLLNGTILRTDGAVTTDVAGAIQTLDENKYKIKANALINISGATYVNISN